MIPVAEARARILAGLRPVGAETVALADACGRVTAADIAARLTQPPHDVSAMDGYAVRGPGPWRVVGHAPAGHPWAGRLAQGEAVRLFTGSLMPDGAECVVIQEDIAVAGDTIATAAALRPAQHIRRQGQDFAAGQTLLTAGRRLTPRDIGLLAAGNHPWVPVRRRPRVAILATGDEIALPGEPIPPGGIVSSNAHALAALVQAAGATPVVLPIAPDDIAALQQAAAGAEGCDLLVTTGGASVGAHDLVAEALQGAGLRLDFWQIAMRPGKPLMHGHLGRLPLLGLPGNPVSALVCALLFLRPAIAALLGLPEAVPPTTRAVLGAALPANDHRADHLRASLATDDSGQLVATAFPRQDSGQLRLLAKADALILRAPHAPAAAAGEPVSVLRLAEFGV
jgi:molybdopterin molybdotransferase